MNPHELLSSDHVSLKKHAAQLRAAMDERPQRLAEELAVFQKAVQKHFKREEPYYRVLDEGKRLEDRGFVHQLRNDHAAVVFTLESLSIRLRKNGLNPDWRGRFDTLMNVFLPHLDLEEKELFPIGKKMLTPEELEGIVRHIEACE